MSQTNPQAELDLLKRIVAATGQPMKVKTYQDAKKQVGDRVLMALRMQPPAELFDLETLWLQGEEVTNEADFKRLQKQPGVQFVALPKELAEEVKQLHKTK